MSDQVLYAPIINNIVDAFTDTTNIIIKFNHNKAVDESNVSGMILCIKNSKGNIIGTIKQEQSFNGTETELTFSISDIKDSDDKTVNLDKGQFYKFQIAYFKDDNIGSYSEIAIGKYAKDKPKISIKNLIAQTNTTTIPLNLFNSDTFVIEYDEEDSGEQLYQYHIELIEYKTQAIVQTSGWQDYYKNSNNVFLLYEELQAANLYKLEIKGITFNGLKLDTVKYYLIKNNGAQSCAFHGFYSINGGNEGYINIIIIPNQETDREYKYQLLRKENNNNHLELIAEFQGNFNQKDYSVEQGVKYEYLIRNINEDKTKITKTLSLGSAIADFEDMYLSDADKMLTIKFNPQVSSIKNTVLEQKTDTIGSQYPFFFRNGNVNYKEIPISGLISYHMDDQELFIIDEELAVAGAQGDWGRSTNLTSSNFTSERKFKLEVLDWLTNGRPKLFRSPAEGNYVVRLMNTSLSPNTTVGRMLHTFSATGYECMPTNYAIMAENKVVKVPEVNSEIKEIIESVEYDGTAEGTQIFIDDDNYTNITLTVEKVTKDTYIELDNNTRIYLTDTTFTTPPGIIYNTVKVSKEIGNPATLTYSRTQTSQVQFPPDDDQNVLVSLFAGEKQEGEENKAYSFEDLLGSNGKIVEIYSMSIEVVPGYEIIPSAYELTIGNNIIDCSDGQMRYYTNLNIGDNKIIKGKGLHINFYGKINNDSPNLKQFILGVSKLGGNQL